MTSARPNHRFLILLLALLAAVFLIARPVGVARAVDGDNDTVDDSIDPCLSPPAGNCLDDDKDNIPNHLDNCPSLSNNDQKNNYGDTRGDACEAESGIRLNGFANKIIAYQYVNTIDIHFYSPTSKKLGAVSSTVLQTLALKGSGASMTQAGEPGITLKFTYNGGNTFTVAVVNADGTTGDSATFPLTLTATATPTPGVATTTTTAASTQSASRTYTVQAGDTLTKIAAKHGGTVSGLAAANNLANSNLIVVGQVLKIP